MTSIEEKKRKGFLEEPFHAALAAPFCFAIFDADCIVTREV